jgi:hypothetical protein
LLVVPLRFIAPNAWSKSAGSRPPNGWMLTPSARVERRCLEYRLSGGAMSAFGTEET